MFRLLPNTKTPKQISQHLFSIRFLHSHPNSSYLCPTTKSTSQAKVGIFWDLENKPPNSLPPYEAAMRLKKAVSSFGEIRYMVAYANPHAFSYVPPKVRDQRKAKEVVNGLENKGQIKPIEPHKCCVCGRRFYNNEKLLNHFKIHEREHQKRLNQIDSAKGRKRLDLVGKYSSKMEKYKKGEREILTPKVGYGLGDELKRAGFWVKAVEHRPQAADSALRAHMVDLMDRRRVECLVLVSDDSDFVGVLSEAKERCFKTVVVGDTNDGVLKRNADAWFSWKEVLVGKARSEGPAVVGQWRDRDVLKKLEWTYKPEMGKVVGEESEGEDAMVDEEEGDLMRCKDGHPWWKLDSESDIESSESDSS